jgi:hypothetical protein
MPMVNGLHQMVNDLYHAMVNGLHQMVNDLYHWHANGEWLTQLVCQ